MKRLLFAFFTGILLLNTSRTDEVDSIWRSIDKTIVADVFPEVVDQQTSLIYIKGKTPFAKYAIEFSFNGGQDWLSLPELGGQVLTSMVSQDFFEMSISIEPQFYFGQLSYENGMKSSQKLKSFLIRAVSDQGVRTHPQALVLFYEQTKNAAQWAAF